MTNLESIARPPRQTLCFFFNDTATTEIYTLSLHDALPIYRKSVGGAAIGLGDHQVLRHVHQAAGEVAGVRGLQRSEEHTSELQSQSNLVCRLLLEKKKFAHGRFGPNIPAGATCQGRRWEAC